LCITRSPCLYSFFVANWWTLRCLYTHYCPTLFMLHGLILSINQSPRIIQDQSHDLFVCLTQLPLVTAAAAAVGPCGGGQWQYALCFLIPIALVCVELPRRREKLTATTMTPMGHSSAMRRMAQTMFGLVLESASATKYKANQTGETRNCFSRCSYFCIVQFS